MQTPTRPATGKQLRYLRWLAEQTGTTFTPPRTVEEASAAIEQMRTRRRSTRSDVTRERKGVSRDMTTRRGDAAHVRSEEISGYGAHATWADPPENGPRVVHCRREEYDVYVGRGNGSPWGNPFRSGRDGTREQVIEMYEEWLLSQPELLRRLPELRGKTLGCWCAPKACHADVLLRLANGPERELPKRGQEARRGHSQGHTVTDGLGLG